jgi:hypothetical protein
MYSHEEEGAKQGREVINSYRLGIIYDPP